MIISHAHRFIFVHCRKVAGSSIKVALAPHLGQDDLVIGSLHEILEQGISLPEATRKVLRKPKARLFTAAALLKGKSRPEALNIGLKFYYRGKLSSNPPHPSAPEIASFFPYEWREYFKFCIVRNPYERVVSDFLWRRRTTGSGRSFREYLELLEANKKDSPVLHPGGTGNWEMMTIDDEIVVDEVGRYENLQEDFRRITKRAGIPGAELNVQAKAGGGSESYGAYYGTRERELVAQMFGKELEHFDYEFPY